ncbi:hypothetical protein WJX84_010267 [Apatococcus fuscideae]|uniref:Uncharacterized protein n=1 Tax=Apatococcus fuscideae TaxID=2026836 RepID=A0AAW1TDR8_9CHLO
MPRNILAQVLLALVAALLFANMLQVAADACGNQDYDSSSYVCPYLRGVGPALCPKSSPCAQPTPNHGPGYGCFSSRGSDGACG